MTEVYKRLFDSTTGETFYLHEETGTVIRRGMDVVHNLIKYTIEDQNARPVAGPAFLLRDARKKADSHIAEIRASRPTPQEPGIGDAVSGTRPKFRAPGTVAFVGIVADVMTDTQDGKPVRMLHVEDNRLRRLFLIRADEVTVVGRADRPTSRTA